MDVYVITKRHDSTYVSVWADRDAAQTETDRLNAEYRAKYGRAPFDMQPDDLN